MVNGGFLPERQHLKKSSNVLLPSKINTFTTIGELIRYLPGRALYQNLKNKRVVSGGSTLTMQTIRLARNKPRTIGEKVIEMIWATRLEFRTSKEEILSMYVSHAPFGGNVVGLDAAAWRYFGHSAEDLSWAESAMLAVLPMPPP